jgi:lipopolysaccharide transport system ATP-binding protein
MNDTVIKVEGISKLYRLGEVGTGTISHDLNRWWARMRGKEDPFSKVGESNDRTTKGNSDYVWALQNISFDIKQGDAVGIIGRNGAGKSTLLKILSRTTLPTGGDIKIKGRVASLLEVGTGFHPELTGRENIYLNGAILGMKKAEINRKFDEIVDFAGVERYVDTPVKRYSSGMYVRLAFGVAAHLESEILIVDEVLAVGDAEFQRKCLGKMKDISGKGGRTVLFVSHNINAILNLTNRAVLLSNGTLTYHGSTDKTVEKYLQSGEIGPVYHNPGNDKDIYFRTISTSPNGFIHNEPIEFDLEIFSNEEKQSVHLGVGFQNSYDENVANRLIERSVTIDKGINRFKVIVSNHNLVPNEYKGLFGIARDKTYDMIDSVIGSPGFTIFNDDADCMLLSKWNKSFGYHYLPIVKIEAR